MATCLLILAGTQGAPPDPAPQRNSANPRLAAERDSQIRNWIQDLGNRQYAKRHQAQTKLLIAGWDALPRLLQASQDPIPERRFRARQLAQEIQQRRLTQEFQQLGLLPDNQINLEQAMISVDRIINPLVDDKDLTRRLDQLAAEVRKKFDPKIAVEQVPPMEAVKAIREVLFKQHDFTGELANYDHPSNSSLDKVLRKHRGLPILLSHVIVAVGDRLHWPFVGVPIPGRYMVKYDGSRAPVGKAQQDILIDPFGGGRILTLDQLLEFAPTLDRETAFEPSTRRETVVRMLRNLESDFLVTGAPEQAEQTAKYRLLVDR